MHHHQYLTLNSNSKVLATKTTDTNHFTLFYYLSNMDHYHRSQILFSWLDLLSSSSKKNVRQGLESAPIWKRMLTNSPTLYNPYVHPEIFLPDRQLHQIFFSTWTSVVRCRVLGGKKKTPSQITTIRWVTEAQQSREASCSRITSDHVVMDG